MVGNLLILGAGQYGCVAKEIAEEMKCFDKIDFLDDNNEIAIGKISDYRKYISEYSHAFVAIGNADLRNRLIKNLEDVNYKIAILISPRAYVSTSAELSKGCIVEPMAVVQTNSNIGVGCIISSGAVVRHNAKIGDVCHIDCNAIVMSNTVVPFGTKVECGKVFMIKELPKAPENYCFEYGV